MNPLIIAVVLAGGNYDTCELNDCCPSDCWNFFITEDQALDTSRFCERQLEYIKAQKLMAIPITEAFWAWAEQDCNERTYAWNCLYYAKIHEKNYPYYSHQNLRQLRDTIGHESYYRGIMPSPIVLQIYPK